MLTIRLSRKGQRNRPMYRLIISENTKDPYDKPLEFLGSYNPYSKELKAKEERIRYWLSQGAGMSPSVNNLLISKNIIEGEKVKASKGGQPEQTSAQTGSQESSGGEEAEAEQAEGSTEETASDQETENQTPEEATENPENQEGSEPAQEEQSQETEQTEEAEQEENK